MFLLKVVLYVLLGLYNKTMYSECFILYWDTQYVIKMYTF